ncbi:Cu(I)-responsive transcriptional regulator [Photobacterium halotolerans]|uniref:HTH-type transcriptional regulator CueR n=2 Tax=Photobacterium halotolerans TaxID=265726 RepID=A0A7X4WDY4_9GAMM|nr:Cu(I)-responsive transcriptional regulator [Photobacterium halotolerans]NAW88642.1 Cu(I)-responsive transcriptional regulator [Photobacterium halotolerans]NAX45849.1 Cu(I)-responsive transcriptional regulator [Photobacterium halotolerans]
MMNISEVAKQTGLTNKTIRFYESKGMISEPQRGENGYRRYSQKQVNELLMIKRSRLVGFSLDESRELLALSRDPDRKSADVKEKAEHKLAEIDHQIQELLAMKQSLQSLISQCPGNNQPGCPIIDALTKGEAETG